MYEVQLSCNLRVDPAGCAGAVGVGGAVGTGVGRSVEVGADTRELVVLALGAIIAGYAKFIGLEHFMEGSESVDKYVQLVAAEELNTHRFNHTVVTIISILVVVGGIAVAWWVYYRPDSSKADAFAAGALLPVRRVLANKYYVDELYDTIFVRPLRRFGDVCFGNDNWVIDSLLWIIAFIPRILGGVVRTTQRGLLQGYALLMLLGLAIVFFFVLWALERGF